MNYTVKKDNGIVTLLINGNEAICPYKPDNVIPGQNALGQMQMNIMRTPCSTNCPFADYIESGNVIQYSIECAGMAKYFDIDETETDSKIINL
jgi:hypothetical protein